LIGGSPAIRRVMQLIERVAPTGSTVLIRGASGTGKELVARALHANSTRRDRPLVTINCAALQETLLESELFGHEKGSFTGAMVSKPGLFELAEGGTLFIDEVAEMAPGLQAKLLRILEDGTYRRVGGTTEYHSDVRVIAATNRPLENEILAGRFREDLFYRLNVFTIPLPLLKDRREDIPELVNHFLNTRPVGGERCRIDPAVIEILQRHDWPGNVRELANVLERAQILSEGGHITPADLPESLIAASGAESVVNSSPENPNALRVIERRHVAEIMRRCNGNKVQAAKQLGVSRRALYRLLAKHDLLGTPQRRGR
jgi:transcriptional regulator with PAS, ATPase and Fis domain